MFTTSSRVGLLESNLPGKRQLLRGFGINNGVALGRNCVVEASAFMQRVRHNAPTNLEHE